MTKYLLAEQVSLSFEDQNTDFPTDFSTRFYYLEMKADLLHISVTFKSRIYYFFINRLEHMYVQTESNNETK